MAVTGATRTSGGSTWYGTCSPRRNFRCSRSAPVSCSPVASVTAAISAKLTRWRRAPRCAPRATTPTSAACRPIRPWAGSTIQCSVPSSICRKASSRASFSMSSRISCSMSGTIHVSTNPSPRRWKRREWSAGSPSPAMKVSASPICACRASSGNSSACCSSTGQNWRRSTSWIPRSRKNAGASRDCSRTWNASTAS